ncbi:MAG: ATP-binding protein [Sinimarinibacterium sp.]|jgi:hypothetical protein
MTEESLNAFLALSIAEGPYLDYKQALSGTSAKEAKREFLKDVTGFANAAGGTLLIGVLEPSENRTVDEQCLGLEDGEALAKTLERLANSCVDPRIPGLLVVNVPRKSGRSCIVVHVPPSLGRPHMVQHEGHRSFHIRHSESTDHMTTHEIREAVLTSASAEMRARGFVERRLNEARRKAQDKDAPAFFLQAMPLIAPPDPWDVFSKKVDATLRNGGTHGCRAQYISFSTGFSPRPTIDGVLVSDERDEPTWEIEVHRTGYLSLFCWNKQTHPVDQRGTEHPVVHSGFCDLFSGFAGVLTAVLEDTSSDLTYLMTCAYLCAQDTCLWTESTWMQKFGAPFGKPEIVWPEHVRPTGGDPQLIAQQMATELFNAFGQRKVVK